MTKTICLVCVLLSAMATAGYAQSEGPLIGVPNDGGPEAPPAVAPTVAGFPFGDDMNPARVMWRWAGRQQDELHAWGEAWRKAKSDEERAKIKSKTNKYLEKQFAADMERREKELEQIEARLVRLRGQLAKRADKKNEIIALQLKQVTMSWEGLGWSDPQPSGTWFGVRTPAPPGTPAPPAPPAAESPAGPATTASAKYRIPFPVPPVAEGPVNFATTKSMRVHEMGTRSQKLMQQIFRAAHEENNENLRELAVKVADQAMAMEVVEVNSLVWTIHEQLADVVENKEFWLILAKAAHEASDGIDDDQLRSQILDTAAHCYFLADDVRTAYELQGQAVEASAEAQGGKAQRAIAGFHEKLRRVVDDGGEARGGAR